MDWLTFLVVHNIDHVTRGPNVGAGDVNIKCPWCTDDPSHHLGISLSGKGYYCLRDRMGGHSGRSAARLIQAVLKCSREHARRLAGNESVHINDFLGQVQAHLGEPIEVKKKKLSLLPEFKPLANSPSCRPYVKYLCSRNYTFNQIMTFTKKFGIRYCKRGVFGGRIIFPIYYEDRLVTWTGRSIIPNLPRYKNLTVSPDKAKAQDLPTAIGPTTDYLLWYDDILKTDADTIYYVEGPFDALRIRMLGEKYGITSTCFFTAGPSAKQIDCLHVLNARFKRQFLLLDEAAFAMSIKVSALVASLGIVTKQLPSNIKDPGEMYLNDLLGIDRGKSLT